MSFLPIKSVNKRKKNNDADSIYSAEDITGLSFSNSPLNRCPSGKISIPRPCFLPPTHSPSYRHPLGNVHTPKPCRASLPYSPVDKIQSSYLFIYV